MENASDKFVENIETHILCPKNFFDNRAIYEINRKILYSRKGHMWQCGSCERVLDT